MSALADAARAAVRVDLSQAAPVAGLVLALPVGVLFAVGAAAGQPKLALTLGVGANLVAVNSLVGSHRARPGLALLDVLGLGAATFVGSATSFNEPLHLLVLGAWSFAVGLLVVLGVQEASAGVQSVIAFVVFGRYVEAPLGASELGALVMAGGAVEVAALVVLRLPPTYRSQRQRLAAAYRALADLAVGDTTTTTVETALDAAAALLSASRLVGDPDVGRLRALLDEGRRIRLELGALAGLRRQLALAPGSDAAGLVEDAVQVSAIMVRRLGDAIGRSRRGHGLGAVAPDLPSFAGLHDAIGRDSRDPDLVAAYLAHLDALGGQLRAANHLALVPLASASAAPVRRTPFRLRRRLHDALATRRVLLGDALDPHSSALRHAVRLGVAVPGAELIGRALNFPRSYWVALTVVVVLKPDYQSLFRAGLGRVLGTIVGATSAALLIGGLHPDSAWLDAMVVFSAFAAYTIWPASFPIAVACFTALVLVLLSVTQVDTIATAFDRFLDTVTGGAIALGVYLVWPTWSKRDAYAALAQLERGTARYLVATLGVLQSATAPESPVSDAARAVRLAWSDAEAAIGRSLAEPASRRIDPDFANGALAALRRVIQATHALAVEAAHGRTVGPSPALAPIGEAISGGLEAIADDLDARRPSSSPAGLRERCDTLVSELAAAGASPVVGRQLDELVDAVDTLGVVSAPAGRPGSAPAHDAPPPRP